MRMRFGQQVLSFLTLFGAGTLLGSPFDSAMAAPVETFADSTYVTKQSRLWTEPTKFGEPIVLMKPGVKLRVLRFSTSGAWLRVVTEGDREGWVPIRFTALSGRRGQPLVSGSNAESEVEAAELSSVFTGSDRSPASLDVEAPSSAAGGGGPRKNTPYLYSVGVGYVNQLTRGGASGARGEIAMQRNFTATLGGFVGFDYHFVYEKTNAYDIDLSTARRSSDFAPHVGLRWTPSEFSVGFALGYAYDHTAVTSRQISSGEIVYDAAGLTVTGNGSTSMLLVKLNPRYALNLGDASSLDIGLSYDLFIDFGSGIGTFASEPGSRALHNFGATVSFSQGF